MKILDLVDDVRSGCKSVLTTMTLEEYKKLSFLPIVKNLRFISACMKDVG